MKSLIYLLLSVLSCVQTTQAQDEYQSLFNGKDLTDWDGNPDLWSVEDGCITGKTTGPDHLSYNQFLIWRGGKVRNFELRAMVRQSGNNSGIQYRSKELPENGKWSIGGYQCDIHPTAANNAMVYEERARGIIVQNGQSVVIDPNDKRWLVEEREPVTIDVADWHEYTIIANGNHLIHKVDDKVTIDLVDFNENSRSLEGLLAFQIHRGPAMSVQIKDVRLKTLPDTDVTVFDKAALPASARLVEKQAPGQKNAAKNNSKTKQRKQDNPDTKTPAKSDNAASDGKKPDAGHKIDAKDDANNKDDKKDDTKGKEAAKDKPKRPAVVGPAVKGNKATPIDRIKTAKGFQAELLYSVPGVEQGSWVNLCLDNKQRILVSDQYGGLYRFTPPAGGKTLDPKDIEKVPAEIRAVNGMVWAFDALYVGVNDYEKKIPSGLYRLTDSNGDDQLDKVELLRELVASGDHGVHAVLPTPDGKALFLVCGNSTKLTTAAKTSPVPSIWGEDHILPRMPDGRGFMKDVTGPGGIIYRVSPDGQTFDIVASGFRNIFDAAVNHDGELFTYDADMEYDFNTSWYRPARINHVVSGAEFGWRNGAGKRPEFYSDNLPATLNIGPGSPTGVTFGYGAKFPEKYQRALYALDWSWGKLYAVHLEPSGSTYKATKEEFLVGAPLPITDAIVHPKDGAMYFTIGGRRVQSGVYRVTYTGSDSTEPIPTVATLSEARLTRQKLEAFHGKQDPAAVNAAWPYLSDSDRFIRWAARTAIEHQPVASWSEMALAESDAPRKIEALMALARVAGVCPQHRTKNSAPVDEAMRAKLLDSLLTIDWKSINHEQRLTLVRTIEITLNRFGRPDDERVQKLIALLDPAFPSNSRELNWLLCETLVYLQSPSVAAKGMELIASAATQEEQIEYARSMRMLKAGWTIALRTAYFEWFQKAASFRGGASFEKFIEFIRTDAEASLTDAEKTALAEILAKKPEKKSAIESLGAIFAGRTAKEWKLDELSEATQSGLKARNFDNGRRMFAAGACFSCHRFGNEGGMTGPDLSTAGRRYSSHDLLDQIINPSKVINEQFSAVTVITESGLVHNGVVVNLNGDTLTLNTDLTDPNLRVTIDRKEIEEMEPSKTSPMPLNLLQMMTKEEVLDLVAYVLSGGEASHEYFRK